MSSSNPNKRKREDESDNLQKQLLSKAVDQLKTTPKNPNIPPTNPRPLPTASLHRTTAINSLSPNMTLKQAAAIATQNRAVAHPSAKFSLLPSAPSGMYQTITKKAKIKASSSPINMKPANDGKKGGASFIDEIINESNDLLQAAKEAQSLGRLKSSYGYLLLTHARLVGLGRRFDRSRCLEDEMSPSSSAVVSAQTKEENKNDNSSASQDNQNDNNSNSENQNNDSSPDNQDNSNSTILQPPSHTNPQPLLPPMPIAHNALSDVTLMEHLARSAMELHHKRTGRGMQHDHQMEKMANVTPKAKGKAPNSPAASFLAAGSAAAGGGGAAATDGGVKEEDLTPTKRKGGRGKKPPTLVMHTLLGAELDAKKLMRISPDS
ncbi:hypothetical protein ACHAXN_010052 [Cyclotella atomus]